jgi:glycosyltransferase involved in cell wall biosynthesis
MITAHVIVKNEENFIWYSVLSVINYVDEVLICDTGSTDKTIKIIDELIKKCPRKIKYKQIGTVDKNKYSEVRQEMLNITKNGWILILDADEIWWDESIMKVCNFVNNNEKYETVIVPTYNLVGDIFHFQEKSAGKYKFGNQEGHYALRLINKNIPGLHVVNEYGKEGFADSDNIDIQNRDINKQKFIDAPYVHPTHLVRSSKDNEVMQRAKKMKYEIGEEFPIDFYYPESFFRARPSFVPNVWINMTLQFKLRAIVETPLRKIKRRIS